MFTDDKKTILVIDDDITIRKLISHHLNLNNYKVLQAQNTYEGFDFLDKGPVDLVLCDVNLGEMDGFTFCQKVRENPDYRSVPFVFVTAKNTLKDKTKALEVGGDDFITKPFDVQELIIKVKSLIRRFEIHKLYGTKSGFDGTFEDDYKNIKILLIDDDVTISQLFEYNLNKAGFDCKAALSADEGLVLVKSFMPDIIISDIMMPKTDGFQFRKIILEDSNLSSIPFIFLTAKGNEQDILEGYNLDIADYIVKTSGPKVVVAKVKAIVKSLNKTRNKVVSELHHAADSIRAKVVPTQEPDFSNFKIEHWHVPYAGVPGGDFIDFIPLDENNIAIILGDVMGKKWGAWYFAFAYAGYVRSAVRTVLESGDATTPAAILRKVNHSIYQDSKISEVFTTLSVIVLDNKNMVLKYSGAGDLPVIYKKAGKNNSIKILSEGMLLGFSNDSDYENSEVKMNPGDCAVLISDGIIETTNEKKEQFGSARLLNLLNSTNGKDSIIEKIKGTVSEFSNGNFEDDISLITIQSFE
ncbi:MAG: response regulator [Ignavibacteria bacterium]|nr:response regulator [Ignavibacteria bacterium]NNL20811.1 response regulator [Ignavibacteriaceae bacterium]